MALAAGLLCSTSAFGLTLAPVFDSSVTSNTNAAAIEAAVNTAAGELSSAFANPATVRFNVSWGSVQGAAIPTSQISSSVENLSGPYSYATLTGYFRSAAAANPNDPVLQSVVAHLPASSPAGSLSFDVPYGEAQAIGLMPASMRLAAGGIGFNSSVNWDYDSTDGISAGAYDLEGAATHEIAEILGRISGIQSSRPTLATPFDLFRYTAAGVSSFSYTASAYLSVDGGQTILQRFNATGSGDRSDIASGGAADVQNAYLSTGRVLMLSSADLTALDALGWGAFTAPSLDGVPDARYVVTVQSAATAVPEPSSWGLMILGLAGIGGIVRRVRTDRKEGAGAGSIAAAGATSPAI